MGIDAEQMEMDSNTRKKQCNESIIERQTKEGTLTPARTEEDSTREN